MPITKTTLTIAITNSTEDTITLASVTGLVPTDLLQVDNEFMNILPQNTTSIDTSALTVKVYRGVQSRAVPHGLNSVVRFGPPQEFGEGRGSFYNPKFAEGLFVNRVQPNAQIATAAAVTYGSGALLSGLILRDPAGAGRTDVLPTAALLLRAIAGAEIGTTIEFVIQNDADAAETITVSAGTGGTTSGTMTVAQNNSKTFRLTFTNITPGAEAYTVYNVGTFTT